ncbi:MAG: hypothetical protein A3E87_04440 [Gammaproteobacteria bacterium RIFCSPHIGHO2_12_FULL_35_23]|nr:MAG: hypothetical protein A3E87_04440 [Gammaproteobacteria bacterium RIFCSPHIGHO2_12_FULL_35_23]
MITPLSSIGLNNVKMLRLFAKQNPEYASAVKQFLIQVKFPEISRSLRFNTLPCGQQMIRAGKKSIQLFSDIMNALNEFLKFPYENICNPSSTNILEELIRSDPRILQTESEATTSHGHELALRRSPSPSNRLRPLGYFFHSNIFLDMILTPTGFQAFLIYVLRQSQFRSSRLSVVERLREPAANSII